MASPKPKLEPTVQVLADVLEMHQAGKTQDEIAEHFGVSQATVYRFIKKHFEVKLFVRPETQALLRLALDGLVGVKGEN